ncbi:hypothetical protein AMTRI_Chr10g3770 [Amborella trichopoda]
MLQCQKFLGCPNFVQDLIPKLSEKTKKIRKAMKEEPVRWTEAAAQKVRQLKTKAQSLPPLTPVYGGPFILFIDASSDTWAAVLLKKDNKKEKICAYTSDQFKTHEPNYYPAEK